MYCRRRNELGKMGIERISCNGTRFDILISNKKIGIFKPHFNKCYNDPSNYLFQYKNIMIRSYKSRQEVCWFGYKIVRI